MLHIFFIAALSLLGISDQHSLQLDDPYRCTGLFIQLVKIADMDVPALIDTGSAACTIDTQFYNESLAGTVAESGKELVLSADGSSHRSVSFVVPIQMENFDSVDAFSVVANLKGIATTVQTDIKAIVGVNCLDQDFVTLHGATGRISRTREIGTTEKLHFSELRARKGRFLTSLTFPTIGSRDCLIDTGMNTAIALQESQLEQLVRSGDAVRITEDGAETLGVNSRRSAIRLYWLRYVDVAGKRFENVLATTSQEAIIGMQILRHFDVTFNLKQRLLRMKTLKNADHARFAVRGTDFKAVFDRSGRLFFRDDKYSNGARELAGIKPGDEIIEIDGDSVDEYTFYSVTDRFSEAGTNLHLKCRRDGKGFEVDLVLKSRYQYPPEWPPEREEFNPDAVSEK